MARTLNAGIGMAAIVDPARADEIETLLAAAGETVYRIGAVEGGIAGVRIDGTERAWAAEPRS